MMDKFSQDNYLKKRIKEIYRGRPCDLIVVNGKLLKRNPNGSLTQIFTNPKEYLDRIEEKFVYEDEKRNRKKIIAVKKAVFKGAIITGSAIAFLAWFSLASKVGKQGIKNQEERFSSDTSYSDFHDFVERGR